jgi:uncharacterized protein YukE
MPGPFDVIYDNGVVPRHPNYDTGVSKVYVEPDTLGKIGNNLKQNAQDVASTINNIANTLSDLQLGWAGQTAQEAEDFGNRWTQVMTELFGTHDDPSKGVLNAIVVGLLTAQYGYSTTEQALVTMFNQFRDQLAQGGGDTTTPPPNITDPNQTAVSETF